MGWSTMVDCMIRFVYVLLVIDMGYGVTFAVNISLSRLPAGID